MHRAFSAAALSLSPRPRASPPTAARRPATLRTLRDCAPPLQPRRCSTWTTTCPWWATSTTRRLRRGAPPRRCAAAQPPGSLSWQEGRLLRRSTCATRPQRRPAARPPRRARPPARPAVCADPADDAGAAHLAHPRADHAGPVVALRSGALRVGHLRDGQDLPAAGGHHRHVRSAGRALVLMETAAVHGVGTAAARPPAAHASQSARMAAHKTPPTASPSLAGLASTAA